MPSSLIYQYIWRDYSLPTHKSLVLTLKDNEAIAFLAMVTTIVALGIVLPWTLSGGMETPIVRSRETDSCIGMEIGQVASRRNAELATNFYRRCWFDRPTSSTSCSRTDGVLSDRPELLISQVDKCPFSGNSCKNGTTGFLLEHQDIVPRQYGLNIKQQVSMSHRLTCAPLETANFLRLVYSDRAYLTFTDKSIKPDGEGIHPGEYSIVLRSLNGPNQYSKNLSGRQAAMESRPIQLHIWPTWQKKPKAVNLTESSKRLDHRLRKEGGSVFVIGFQAGRSYFGSPIDDPMFSAHDHYDPGDDTDGIYFPDYEITTIGCLEQHKFCLTKPTRFCTPWGTMNNWDNVIAIDQKLLELGHSTLGDEMGPIYWQIMTQGTVQNYLFDWDGIKASITFQHRKTELFEDVDKNEQWLVELKAWFETSFLASRYKLINLLEPVIPPGNFSRALIEAKRAFGKTCNKALFYSSDYTNIDFAKLLTTLFCLLLICLLSIRNILIPIIKFVALWSWNKLKSVFEQGCVVATKVQERIALVPKPAIRMPKFRFPRRHAIQPHPRNYAHNSFWGPRSTRHMEIPVVPDIQPSDIGLQEFSVES